MFDLRPGKDRDQGECMAGCGAGKLLWTVGFPFSLPSMPPPLCLCSGQILWGSHLSQGKSIAFPPRVSGREMR